MELLWKRLNNRLKLVLKSSGIRNIALVASGTAVSQIISFSIIPFVTRLYGPKEYGLLGVYSSVSMILSTVAALGYPSSIVLPRKDIDALILSKISIYVSVIMSFLLTIFILLFGDYFLKIFDADDISPYIYLLPFSMIVSTLGVVFSQWLIRKKAYGNTVGYSVVTSLIVAINKVGLGYFYPTAFILIISNLLGSFLGSVFGFFSWLRSGSLKAIKIKGSSESWRKYFEVAADYGDFPIFRTPQNLINMFSQSLPVLFLASYSGASSAGYYTLVKSALGLPAALIGSSVISVLYPRIAEAIHDGENVYKILLRATYGMAAVGIWPFLAVVIAGPFLFATVFGREWMMAGHYAQLLSAWFFFQYLNKPVVAAIPALTLQRGLLFYEVFSTGFKVVALCAGLIYFKNDVIALALFSSFGVISYVCLILWVLSCSKKA